MPSQILPIQRNLFKMINQTIEFYVENKFGNDHMYLKNERDHWILSLTNTETLRPRHKSSLKKAGYKFVQTFKNY